jgi:UDP-GlcNAc:undecaprenyl-phosphate/decaprenyl-phosphate GlcNAc-1-phosphate transferase
MFMLFTTFFAASFLGWCATKLMEPAARRWQALSLGGFRREDGGGIPLLGGLAVAIAFLSVLWAIDSSLGLRWTALLLPLIVCGVWDDKYELRARYKMIFQFSAVLLWWVTSSKEQIFFSAFGAPEWLSFALSSLWIMGLMNATNMIDGVDGLAGTVALATAACIPFALNIPHPELLIAFGGCFAGFLFRNWHPAKIYMGEVGSPMIGFVLGTSLMEWQPLDPNWTHIAVPLLFMLYPEIDLWSAIIRRVRDGKSVLSGDRNHIHHQLIRLGLSARGVSITAGSITIIAGLFAITLSKGPQTTSAAWTLMCGLVSLGAFYTWMFLCMQLFTLKTGRIGQGFIEKYFALKQMPRPSEFTGRVVVLDVHGYYKILQARGVDHIAAFVHDIRKLTESCCGVEAQYWFTGLSTIMVGIDMKEFSFAFQRRMQIEFTEVLERHNVRLYEDNFPVGLRFLEVREAEAIFSHYHTENDQLQKAS